MKKIITIMLAACMLLAVCACKSGPELSEAALDDIKDIEAFKEPKQDSAYGISFTVPAGFKEAGMHCYVKEDTSQITVDTGTPENPSAVTKESLEATYRKVWDTVDMHGEEEYDVDGVTCKSFSVLCTRDGYDYCAIYSYYFMNDRTTVLSIYAPLNSDNARQIESVIDSVHID